MKFRAQHRCSIGAIYSCHKRLLIVMLTIIGVIGIVVPGYSAGVVLLEADTDYDFDAQTEIHLMRINGTGHRRLQPRYPMSSASVHPRGHSVAYARADKAELRIINTDGKKDRLLTKINSTTEKIAWSPDGRYITFEETTFSSNTGISLGLSYFDVKTKKLIRGIAITSKSLGGALNNGITRISWSPNGRTVAVTVTDLFVAAAASTFNATYIVNVSQGTSKKLANAKHFDFLNNNKILAKRQDLSLGYLHINKPNQFFQLANIGNGFDHAIPINGGKSALVRYRYFLGEKFDISDTNLTSISGTSQSDRLAFDLIDINLKTRAGKFVTPKNTAFLPSTSRFFGMQWVRQSPNNTF